MHKTTRTGVQFRKDLENGKAILGVVGTSRVGKTTTSRKLAHFYDGIHEEFDEMVEQEDGMQALVNQRVGERLDISCEQQMGIAIGNPFENREYPEDQEVFLSDEKKAMRKYFKLFSGGVARNTFLDFTGSAPYARKELDAIINQDGVVVVYLQASQEHMDLIVQTYLKEPSPIYWGKLAKEMYGKDIKSELTDYMQRLLKIRHELYSDCCDITIPWEDHRSQTPDYLVEQIILKLPSGTKA